MDKHFIKKIIRKHAISLAQLGVSDLAWKRNDVIVLINALIGEDIGILGGDVCLGEGDSCVFLGDNWSVAQNNGEKKSDFFLRSKIESRDYIERYPIIPKKEFLFSIVFTEFIGMHKNGKMAYNCRVCGCEQEFEPWGEDGETPSFDVCVCCGVLFGSEDCKEIEVKKFREEWIRNGAKWFVPNDEPQGWSSEEQMKGIPDKFI